MKITILTLFPEMFEGFKTSSIIKRAIGKGVVEVEVVNIRDYTLDKYNRTDTPPIGGGAGLIEKAQPIVDAIKAKRATNSKVYLMSPRGPAYNQRKAVELSKLDHIILVCGHYEGVDERINPYIDEHISIGDYIITGGEIPAMAISDSFIRLLDGAISSPSLEDESFNDNTLEYPQYTEPYEYEGMKVPDILYCGNHEAVKKWRRRASLLLTREHRPDLFAKLTLSKQDKKLLDDYDAGITPKWESEALEKGKRFIKK